jgi:hypothetical protein
MPPPFTTAGVAQDLPMPRTRGGFRSQLFERYAHRKAEPDSATRFGHQARFLRPCQLPPGTRPVAFGQRQGQAAHDKALANPLDTRPGLSTTT